MHPSINPVLYLCLSHSLPPSPPLPLSSLSPSARKCADRSDAFLLRARGAPCARMRTVRVARCERSYATQPLGNLTSGEDSPRERTDRIPARSRSSRRTAYRATMHGFISLLAFNTATTHRFISLAVDSWCCSIRGQADGNTRRSFSFVLQTPSAFLCRLLSRLAAQC